MSKPTFVRTVPAWVLALIIWTASPAPAADATLRLTSPQAATTVRPGARIEWAIEVGLGGESEGLALVLVDLVQDPANPATLDLPPADRAPANLAGFHRPLGFSNPGADPDDDASGYLGTPVGPAGARDLAQIGGAQNTTGVVGETMGRGTDLALGVGSDGDVTLARGSFLAPAAPGTYRFALSDAQASVITAAREAPLASTVEAADVTLAPGAFTFVVESGDSNCDGGCFVRGNCDGEGEITITDAIVLLSFNFLANAARPPCLAACDANGDGAVVGSVTDAVYLLGFLFLGGPPPATPFPECGPGTAADAAIGCDRVPGVCQ